MSCVLHVNLWALPNVIMSESSILDLVLVFEKPEGVTRKEKLLHDLGPSHVVKRFL